MISPLLAPPQGFLNLSFSEPQIERSFRKMTLEAQRRDFFNCAIGIAVLFLLNLGMDVPTLLDDTYNVTHCHTNSSMTQEEIEYFMTCDKDCRHKYLLYLRLAMIFLSLFAGLVLQKAGRRVSLGCIMVSIWLISLGNDLVLPARFLPLHLQPAAYHPRRTWQGSAPRTLLSWRCFDSVPSATYPACVLVSVRS